MITSKFGCLFTPSTAVPPSATGAVDISVQSGSSSVSGMSILGANGDFYANTSYNLAQYVSQSTAWKSHVGLTGAVGVLSGTRTGYVATVADSWYYTKTTVTAPWSAEIELGVSVSILKIGGDYFCAFAVSEEGFLWIDATSDYCVYNKGFISGVSPSEVTGIDVRGDNYAVLINTSSRIFIAHAMSDAFDDLNVLEKTPPVALNIKSFTCGNVGGQIYYLIANNYLYCSIDECNSWTAISKPTGVLKKIVVQSGSVYPCMFILTEGGEVYVSALSTSPAWVKMKLPV